MLVKHDIHPDFYYLKFLTIPVSKFLHRIEKSDKRGESNEFLCEPNISLNQLESSLHLKHWKCIYHLRQICLDYVTKY